jgi:hypothetical protein
MMQEMKVFHKALTVTKMNTHCLLPAYISAGISILAVVLLKFTSHGANINISIFFDALMILPFLTVLIFAFLIASQNFILLMNLGGNRKDFFYGCLVTYVIFAVLAAVVNCVIYKACAIIYPNVELNIRDGFAEYSILLTFFLQFVFLLFIAVIFHTITLVFPRFGFWGMLMFLFAFCNLSIGVPIAQSLNNLKFFDLFSRYAFKQILFYLICISIVYPLSRLILNRKFEHMEALMPKLFGDSIFAFFKHIFIGTYNILIEIIVRNISKLVGQNEDAK